MRIIPVQNCDQFTIRADDVDGRVVHESPQPVRHRRYTKRTQQRRTVVMADGSGRNPPKAAVAKAMLVVGQLFRLVTGVETNADQCEIASGDRSGQPDRKSTRMNASP